ncbi:A-kinase anchoring protein pkaap [Haematobia irritans]|uniref:A-kinase anchoring protein pkaap n=1 Tax=Haematobia irritans TaxID=7368 RepID=UPI003F4FD80C
MFKYFKKQRSRHTSSDCDQVDSVTSDATACGGQYDMGTSKRHSLRSTTSIHSFCDEVFLEELENMGLASGCGGGGIDSDDAVSYGALSLGALSNCNYATGNSNSTANNSNMVLDEDIFKYHSRLSMTLTSIVNEPNCLSYFVQYLENKASLPLIKFYLDTENFKNAALAQLRKELKCKMIAQQIPEEIVSEDTIEDTNIAAAALVTHNDTDDDQMQNKLQQVEKQTRSGERHINFGGSANATGPTDIQVNTDSCHVPELKTLCDLSMRKPLTDDEKSQIYAETNKHIHKTNEKHKLKASSELSLCSLMSNYSEINENTIISVASVKDALAIYTKYLIQEAKERIELPVDILSKISLIICNKDVSVDDAEGDVLGGRTTTITADCFIEAQQYVLNKLEKDFLSDYLQSIYYAKYCVDLIEDNCLTINDILHSEVTLFYFMEYLEQHQERDCLDFWSTAVNYRKSYVSAADMDEKEAQSDAMIIYEKFFSLQNDSKLWSSNKLRAHVEACICTEGMICHCFDLPLRVAAKYLESKYLRSFLKSSLFSNYLNELKSKIQEEIDAIEGLTPNSLPKKIVLRRCVSDKSSNRHRKTYSDCTLDKKMTISQHNTLLASMDNQHIHHPQHQRQQTMSYSTSVTNLEKFQMNIDSSQLTNPDLLWHRSNSNNLKFGRVNSLGRYERDFISPSDALTKAANTSTNWSLALKGNKLKKAMRKLVNLREDNVQEEIAWQVAEMIVKDVTSVTMASKSNAKSTDK